MDKAKEKVLKRIGTLRDEAIELLADLVKADSVNPPGDTRKIMDVIIQKTQTFTQNYDIVAKEEVAPNILITINPGARPQVEPFGAVIKDNAMYGRGVADMKGGVGSMLMAAKALQRENVPLKGSLVVNFVSDEETGGARGARYLMEQDYYSPDMVVVGEITNGNGIAIGEKGDAVYGLSTKGRTAHASTPWVGINAIDKMVKVLFKMESRLGEILKNRPSGYLPPATMNVGSIQGGVSYNVVADTCNVLLDRRTLPGETIDSVTGEIQEIIDEVKSEDPEVDATLRLVGFGEPFETSPDESICQIAKKTLDELGLNSDFVGYEQVSDGRFFAEKGIPTILIGPGIAQRAHTANEHLELDQYMGAIKIYSLLAMNALGY
jgi:succinyl-diaminopimelate desuccinylase